MSRDRYGIIITNPTPEQRKASMFTDKEKSIIGFTVGVFCALITWAIYASSVQSELIASTLKAECGHVPAEDYAGCRFRVLDQNGWTDPTAPAHYGGSTVIMTR